MKSIQDEILLVIPYINGGQGNELELALTGWRKYCKSPLRIVVIGDYNPCIDSKAEYIEYSRTQALKNQYVPNIDVARKLNKIYDLFHEEYDHFVLANDDEYPIKDFDYHFLTQVTFLQDKFMGNASAPTNYWSHDMYKTRQLLDKEKKPHVNYCNHHPFYFDMERFHEVSMKFNLANNSAIRENLYYNYYEFKTVVNVNSIRTGIWDTIDTKKKVQAAIDNPNIKFICNSVAGWSKGLMEMIGNYYGIGAIEKKNEDEKNSIEFLKQQKGPEKIIVSFTSWKKRIHLCAHIVDLMFNQTLKPDKIILNLSTDEFPKKEEELPKELVEKQNDIFEIYWVKENTKAYKKILPTLERYPNDIIISIDDDIEYPNVFIQKMYKRFIEIGKNCPITAGDERCKWKPNIYTHHGAFSLVKKEFLGDYPKEIYENVISKNKKDFIYSDNIYTYAVLLNGKRYFHETTLNISSIRRQNKNGNIDPISNSSKNYVKYLWDQHYAIRDYIKKKYNKSYEDLFDAPIYVNITTWPKRDKYLPIMLESIQKQTLKPDKVILWLSEEEYSKDNIPNHIQECLNDGRLTEIQWVKENTFCHKRYETFKYNSHCYNLLMDDDIQYPKTYIEELYKVSKNNQDCITVYCSSSIEYEYYKLIKQKINTSPSHKNAFMGGLNCFPPYSLPQEVITSNIDLRDKYVTKCDESWVKPFLIKHDIKIIPLKQFNSNLLPSIEDSQNESMWNINKKLLNNEIRIKEKNLFNAIKITHTEKLFKKIWPKIGINNWKLIE